MQEKSLDFSIIFDKPLSNAISCGLARDQTKGIRSMDDLELDRSLCDYQEKLIERAARRLNGWKEPEPPRLTGWDVLNNAIVALAIVGSVWAVVWLVK